VLLELLKARGRLPALGRGIDAVVLIEDESLRLASLRCVQTLREVGLAVEYTLTPAKSDRQFKRALELGARWTVRLEGVPGGEPLACVKNLTTREEKRITPAEAPSFLRAK
jgi:histidyl-tRNA synthetase